MGSDNNSNPEQEFAPYNCMESIEFGNVDKCKDTERFKLIEDGIYEDLHDKLEDRYRMVISYELPDDDSDNQYPLEDILDKYLLYVSDFFESENDPNSNKFKLELGGRLDDMREAKKMEGKKVYNQNYLDEEGVVRVNLVIE